MLKLEMGTGGDGAAHLLSRGCHTCMLRAVTLDWAFLAILTGAATGVRPATAWAGLAATGRAIWDRLRAAIATSKVVEANGWVYKLQVALMSGVQRTANTVGRGDKSPRSCG